MAWQRFSIGSSGDRTPIIATKGIRIDASELSSALKEYAKMFKKALPQVIKDQARWLCTDLCDFTPPFSGSSPEIHKGGEGGFGNKARDKGRQAVARDVNKIFKPLSNASVEQVAAWGNASVFAHWYNEREKLPAPHYPAWVFKISKAGGAFVTESSYEFFVNRSRKWYGGGGSTRAKYIIDGGESEIKKYHEQRRGPRNYRVKDTVGTGKFKTAEITYVEDWKAVQKYIKKVQLRVGKLKSGWYACGKKLGYMPSAAWIEDQGSKTSRIEEQSTGTGFYITVGNTIAQNHSQSEYATRMAINHRYYALRNDIAMNVFRNKGKRGQSLMESMLNLNNLATQSRKVEFLNAVTSNV